MKPISLSFLATVLLIQLATGALPDLTEQEFADPPNNARPFTWWHWMNGNVTKYGITQDLEAMKRVGIGGFHLFNIDAGIPRGPVDYWSPEWFSLLKYAGDEASRLNLEMTFHNCAGWQAAGGPWITPDMGHQQVVWTENTVRRGQPVILPKFTTQRNPQVPLVELIKGFGLNPDEIKQEVLTDRYYRDIDVLAFPTPKRSSVDQEFRLNRWKEKAGFVCHREPPAQQGKTDSIIQKDDILILSERMSPDGTLDWTPPDNQEWTVIRFGYAPTGKHIHPAPPGALGFEFDKMSRAAATLHFQKGLLPIINLLNGDRKQRLKAVLVDSYEAKELNWTPLMPQNFRELRGYELTRYLPALTGRVVNSIDETEHFLWDWRRTISDLIVQNFYEYMTEQCHEFDIELVSEANGMNTQFNAFDAASPLDMPMCEFWADRPVWGAHKPITTLRDLRGLHYVGAEAFTHGGRSDLSPYQTHPALFKMQGDANFALGVNRFIFHTWSHQPFDCSLATPVMSMGPFGTHFNRNNTWFEQSSAWLKYLARCQYMLQKGRLSADVCYFVGDSPKDGFNMGFSRTEFEKGSPRGQFNRVGHNQVIRSYDYDFHTVNGRLLQEMYAATDGRLTHPNGMNYHCLVITDPTRKIYPETLKHIEKLVRNGVTLVGDRPARECFTLEENSRNYEKTVERLFPSSGTSIGKGNVFPAQKDLSFFLKEQGLHPDLEMEPKDRINDVLFMHRIVQDENMEFYFLTNLRDHPVSGSFTFRIEGKIPEIWTPETGISEDAPAYKNTADGRTRLNLSFKENESLFVVFRKNIPPEIHPVQFDADSAIIKKLNDGRLMIKNRTAETVRIVLSSGKERTVSLSDARPLEELTEWSLSFPPEWGGRQDIRLPALTDWTALDRFDEKYFSGTAVYNTELNLPDSYQKDREGLLLDLGDVEVIAEVFLNGKDLGVLWHRPFEIDISDAVKPGRNRLQIKITNTWNNRLCGDAKLPEENKQQTIQWLYGKAASRPETARKSFSIFNAYPKNSGQLIPAGLLGPVHLIPYNKTIIDQ
ncbi:glycosyl hydrolase [Tichowtungia aerotolerans]|uniref:Beta-mannosidase-like galactose-binding domain-containing protein n=1 Tax=Tichowtungia aerotolerans TaxID=2697043 RepID=A0A6P1MCB1_9BACT|nr:glycosyl hydrolase [Tichowtungia aerotolerans]QHI70743.1 hypothetical protein GT409_15285 [Tichowtungia aerotolerans]